MCFKLTKEAHFGEIKVSSILQFQVFIVYVWKEHNQWEVYCNNTKILVAHSCLIYAQP